MNVPTRAYGNPTRLNVTQPLVSLHITPEALRFQVLPPLGWFIHTRYVERSSIRHVHVSVPASDVGRFFASSVSFEVSGTGPWTFWTWDPVRVANAMAEAGYPAAGQ
jgi:hypothetical protein